MKLMGEDYITVSNVCPFCGKEQSVNVKRTDFDKWMNGELVQRAFPYLTPSEREIIITGICDDCFPN